MVKQNQSIFKNIDWPIIIIYFLMVSWGWLNIYSVEHVTADFNLLDFSYSYSKQFFFIIAALIIGFIILIFDARFFTTFSYVFYVLVLLLLVGVLIFGREVAGSKSWIVITDSFRLQPAEFAKIGVALAISKFLSSSNINLNNFKNQLRVLILLIIPMSLILLQKDVGTTMVFLGFFIVFYRFGWPSNIYLISFWLAILFLLALLVNNFILIGSILALMLLATWFVRKNRKLTLTILGVALLSVGFVKSVDYIFQNVLLPHQKDRILVLLGKEHDPRGIGYNINQSLIAIGSGGFTGKGFLHGTQTKFDFVPEQSTDFIFCTVGEEYGFIGSVVLIALFVYLLIRIILLSEIQRSMYSKVYGYSLASILFVHFAVNIAMTINLFPIVGIPLPYFSYGGSSLIAFSVMLFIFIKLNSRKNDLL